MKFTKNIKRCGFDFYCSFDSSFFCTLKMAFDLCSWWLGSVCASFESWRVFNPSYFPRKVFVPSSCGCLKIWRCLCLRLDLLGWRCLCLRLDLLGWRCLCLQSFLDPPDMSMKIWKCMLMNMIQWLCLPNPRMKTSIYRGDMGHVGPSCHGPAHWSCPVNAAASLGLTWHHLIGPRVK